MRRLRDDLRAARTDGKRLIALCYAVFLLASLLIVLYGAAEDAVRRWRGDVRCIEIAGDRTDAFRLWDLEQDGTWYTSLSVDPRMDLDLSLVAPEGDIKGVYVRRVTLYYEDLNMDPGEVCVFYKPKMGMLEYDAIYRVWAHRGEQNDYTFTLPSEKQYGIRIDPTTFAGAHFRLTRIVLNEPRSLWERLTPTRPWLLAAAVAPLLAASALHWVFCAWDAWREKRAARRAAEHPAKDDSAG